MCDCSNGRANDDEAQLFWARASLVEAVLGMLEDLRAWAGGCHCHGVERLAGQRVTCALAGRRGKEAWGRVQQALRDADE